MDDILYLSLSQLFHLAVLSGSPLADFLAVVNQGTILQQSNRVGYSDRQSDGKNDSFQDNQRKAIF